MHQLKRSRSDPGDCLESRKRRMIIAEQVDKYYMQEAHAGQELINARQTFDSDIFDQQSNHCSNYPPALLDLFLPGDTTVGAKCKGMCAELPTSDEGTANLDLTCDLGWVPDVSEANDTFSSTSAWQDDQAPHIAPAEKESQSWYIWRADPDRQSFLDAEGVLRYNADHAACVGRYRYTHDWRGLCAGSDPLHEFLDGLWQEFSRPGEAVVDIAESADVPERRRETSFSPSLTVEDCRLLIDLAHDDSDSSSPGVRSTHDSVLGDDVDADDDEDKAQKG